LFLERSLCSISFLLGKVFIVWHFVAGPGRFRFLDHCFRGRLERNYPTHNMQGLARLVQVQGRALSGSVLQHLRVEGSAFSSTIQAHKESGQPSKDSLEEHGFERSTIADILKEKGQKADGSWLWCTVDETVYDAVKHMTSHNVGALLVVKPGEAKALAGIITERDYLRKIIVQGRSSKTTKVGDIMTEEVNFASYL
jgi:CBS domain-containing protein